MSGIAIVNGIRYTFNSTNATAIVTLATITIDLPSSGTLLLQATGWMQDLGAVGSGSVTIGISSSPTNINFRAPGTVTTHWTGNYAVSSGVSVAPGVQTYYLNARITNSAGSGSITGPTLSSGQINMMDPVLQAIFIENSI